MQGNTRRTPRGWATGIGLTCWLTQTHACCTSGSDSLVEGNLKTNNHASLLHPHRRVVWSVGRGQQDFPCTQIYRNPPPAQACHEPSRSFPCLIRSRARQAYGYYLSEVRRFNSPTTHAKGHSDEATGPSPHCRWWTLSQRPALSAYTLCGCGVSLRLHPSGDLTSGSMVAYRCPGLISIVHETAGLAGRVQLQHKPQPWVSVFRERLYLRHCM